MWQQYLDFYMDGNNKLEGGNTQGGNIQVVHMDGITKLEGGNIQVVVQLSGNIQVVHMDGNNQHASGNPPGYKRLQQSNLST